MLISVLNYILQCFKIHLQELSTFKVRHGFVPIRTNQSRVGNTQILNRVPISLECEVSDIIAKKSLYQVEKKNQIGDGIFTENLLVYHRHFVEWSHFSSIYSQNSNKRRLSNKHSLVFLEKQ